MDKRNGEMEIRHMWNGAWRGSIGKCLIPQRQKAEDKRVPKMLVPHAPKIPIVARR